jgi:hypothetical protein
MTQSMSFGEHRIKDWRETACRSRAASHRGVGKGFDSGNALHGGMGQYPKIGVEFVHRFSQTHQVSFVVG